MKKIVLVMLSLCILAGLQATPMALQKKDAIQLVNNTKSHITHVAKPANAGKVATPQFEVMRMQQPAELASARKATSAADTLALTIKSDSEESGVYYLGNYFYWYVYDEWLGDYWDLFMETNQGAAITFQFVGPSDKRIEGTYKSAFIEVAQGSDTLDAFGNLSISYFSAGTTSSPTYQFSGIFEVEEENLVITVNGTYAFPSQSVIDLGKAYACEDGEEEYCGQEEIILIDAPVNPTGDTISVAINGAVKKQYSLDEGWDVWGDDLTQELMFEAFIYTETLEGTYTDPTLFDMGTTKLLDYGAGEYVELKSITGAEITKDIATGNYSFEFFALGLEGNIYDITMQYIYPIPVGDTINIEITEGDFTDYRDDYGILVAQGIDKTDKYIYFSAVYSDELVGEFTEMDRYGSDMNYVGIIGSKDTVYYDADRFQLTVDTITYQGALWHIYELTLVGVSEDDPTDVKAFNIYLQAKEPDPFEYDATTGVVKTISVDRNELINTKYFDENGVVYIQFSNTKVQFQGVVFPTALDERTILPVGEYPISEDMTAPSVMASPGYSASKGAYPTYYSTLITYEGKTYLNDIWFFRSGKMTMSNEKMVFSGKNSNEQPIQITFKFLQTDLSEVLKDAAQSKRNKVVVNHHFYILREGKAYNAFGMGVK